MESRGRLLQEVLPIAKELLREYQHILPRLTETEEIDIVDKLTAHFIARLGINTFQDAATAWVLRIDGQERLRSQEAHFLDRTSLSPRMDFTPLDCVTEMRQWFRDQFEPWNPTEVTAAQEDGIAIEAFAMEVDDARVPAFDALETPDDVISSTRATVVAHQRCEFRRVLAEQDTLTLNERLLIPLERGVLQVAITQVRSIARALDLNPDQIEEKLMPWLFTDEIPNTPTTSNLHWRTVHAIDETWTGFARIGVRDASIATSEADVERLLGEQKDVQGFHGINFGTQTFHARLALRYEEG
jgi:hypothetical protein